MGHRTGHGPLDPMDTDAEPVSDLLIGQPVELREQEGLADQRWQPGEQAGSFLQRIERDPPFFRRRCQPRRLGCQRLEPGPLQCLATPVAVDQGPGDRRQIGARLAEGGVLIPSEDALVLETAEGNPYANVLVVKETMKDDPRVLTLAKALESPELAKYILDTYQGSVLPVNG